MADILQFWVPGVPKAQPRVKACRRGNHAGVYDPGTADEWKKLVGAGALAHWNRAQFLGPLKLVLLFGMQRPKAHFNRHGDVKPGVSVWHQSKPDADNLAKAVMDALTQLKVWVDDSQVVRLDVGKIYATRPGCVCILGWASSDDPCLSLEMRHFTG
jgi:Holliday junction resolvase RusA-like endonuclease